MKFECCGCSQELAPMRQTKEQPCMQSFIRMMGKMQKCTVWLGLILFNRTLCVELLYQCREGLGVICCAMRCLRLAVASGHSFCSSIMLITSWANAISLKSNAANTVEVSKRLSVRFVASASWKVYRKFVIRSCDC